MSDVIFVCVRADVEPAEALAEMFEAVGFTTNGYAADDESAGAAPASIVLWSEASVRSRPFLDAAERQIQAGNAIVVCLSEALVGGQIEGTPVFDLSAWNGDANEEAVDPLFFEVDRRVMKARAKPAPCVVALIEDDGPPPANEISEAETDYFVQYGADAFAGMSAGAWSAPVEPEIEITAPQPQPARAPRAYRGAAKPLSILRHGGAAARLMALVLLLGGGVAFAATSIASREAQQVRHAAYEPAPLHDVVMAADLPTPDFVAEPAEVEQALAPAHVREPASAPASALRDLNAAYEPVADTQSLGDAPSPLPFWLEAELSAAPPLGAPLVVPVQGDAMLGSTDLPDELFKPDPKAPAAV